MDAKEETYKNINIKLFIMRWIKKHLSNYDFQNNIEIRSQIEALTSSDALSPSEESELEKCYENFFKRIDNNVFYLLHGIENNDKNNIRIKEPYSFFIRFNELYIPIDDWKNICSILALKEGENDSRSLDMSSNAKNTFKEEWDKLNESLENDSLSIERNLETIDEFLKTNSWINWFSHITIAACIILPSLLLLAFLINQLFLKCAVVFFCLIMLIIIVVVSKSSETFKHYFSYFHDIRRCRKLLKEIKRIKRIAWDEQIDNLLKRNVKITNQKNIDLSELKRQSETLNGQTADLHECTFGKKDEEHFTKRLLPIILIFLLIVLILAIASVFPSITIFSGESDASIDSANTEETNGPVTETDSIVETAVAFENADSPIYFIAAPSANIRRSADNEVEIARTITREDSDSEPLKVKFITSSGDKNESLWFEVELPDGTRGWINRKLLKEYFQDEIPIIGAKVTNSSQCFTNLPFLYDGYVGYVCRFSKEAVSQGSEIILTLEKEAVVNSIILYSGNYNEDNYASYGKVSKIGIRMDGQEEMIQTIDTEYDVEGFKIELNGNTKTKQIVISLKEMEPGTDSDSHTNDVVCLSEIIVRGTSVD